jgi:hypothetical protein
MLDEIIKFQLKRVNPFQGLVIDADAWQDAHNYHRNQQRLHLLAFHKTGIVEGLEVAANDPANLSVTIQPGLAIDPEGNTIIISQTQNYQIQTRQKGIIYLVIQFREIPTEPYQPPEGGQATRILEAYRIEQRDKLPSEPHLELARIDFDPAEEVIRNAKNPSKAGKNEINLSFRQEAKVAAPAKPVAPAKAAATPTIEEPPSHNRKTLVLGHAVLGEADKNLHINGLQNLARETNRENSIVIDIAENISLDNDIGQYAMIYLTGNSSFELSEEQQAALSGFLKSNGVIFGEGCSEGQEEAKSKGAREFGLAFNQLASQLNCKLETIQHGHPLLSAAHIFSAVPRGAEPNGLILQGGQMVYSGSDYGCAWQGGHEDDLLSRDIIRSSFEMGANIIAYAHMTKSAER